MRILTRTTIVSTLVISKTICKPQLTEKKLLNCVFRLDTNKSQVLHQSFLMTLIP